MKKDFLKVNENIKSSAVRLVDHDGEMLGIVSIADALARAKAAGLDLVEIVPNAEPPVCKILNYAKFRYDAKKHKHDAKKKQKVVLVKEIKFKPNIGDGDFGVKLRKIKEFLSDGNKVKVSLWFRGREIVHNDIGLKLFDRILENIVDCGKVEFQPKLEGKQLLMILAPMSHK